MADELSKVPGAEFLALVISPANTDLFQDIKDCWTSDRYLKQLIEELQQTLILMGSLLGCKVNLGERENLSLEKYRV